MVPDFSALDLVLLREQTGVRVGDVHPGRCITGYVVVQRRRARGELGRHEEGRKENRIYSVTRGTETVMGSDQRSAGSPVGSGGSERSASVVPQISRLRVRGSGSAS